MPFSPTSNSFWLLLTLSATLQCTPNPADRKPATLKTYPPLSTSGSFSDIQNDDSLPR